MKRNQRLEQTSPSRRAPYLRQISAKGPSLQQKRSWRGQWTPSDQTKLEGATKFRIFRFPLNSTMNTRQSTELALIIFFSFVSFASWHEGTGSTAWLQWLSLVVLLAFSYIFDVSFTDDSMFVFDPDADNWRRKTEGGKH